MNLTQHQVYLAGPITGLNYGACTDWRKYAKQQLESAGIQAWSSPMRGKEYLETVARDKPFTADGNAYSSMGPLSSDRGIVTRDRWDATRCDVILVNFLGAKQVSIGTVFEIAWADLSRIPVVCCMEPTGNPHEHGFIKEAIGFRVETLDYGIDIVKAILT